MAIDRVKKLCIVLPVEQTDRVISRLHELRMVHLSDCAAEMKAEGESLQRLARSSGETESQVKRLEYVLDHFDKFSPPVRGLAENFVSVPLLVTPERVRKLVESVDIAGVYAKVHAHAEQYLQLEKREADLHAEIAALEPLQGLGFSPAQAQGLHYTAVRVGFAPAAKWEALESDAKSHETMAWEVLPIPGGRCRVVAVFLKARETEAVELLRSAEFTEVQLSSFEQAAEERIAEDRKALAEIAAEKGKVHQVMLSLAQQREEIQIVHAHYLAESDRAHAQAKLLRSRRMSLLSGYVRTRDAERLAEVVAKEFPSASLRLEDPTPQDNVPVSITLNPLLRPVQLLVNMFGLPNYFGFDPTPFIAITFLSFFGICFGDVIYGLMLFALAGFLAHKARRHPGLRSFCALFVYAGISTMIFGALTGSWASDLADPKYLGENNLLLRMRNMFYVFDPLANTIAALLIALGIGICNQFYGIILLMYRNIRQGQVAAAIFDGGSWLILLPGFIITAARLFVVVPAPLATGGLALLAVGATMLVLTQGRNEETFAAKAITGVVSLYGILGTYGCTSFLGDVLSYSRLLALGLTTSIVGMAFNIIAGLLGDVPRVGGGLFVLMVIFGHTFNFAMSILGAFVHPARLIFLEFFGRFYEGGATAFRPFGFGTPDVNLLES